METPEKYLQYRFPGQAEGEHIKVLVRKHWVIAVKIGILFFVLAVVPVLVALALAIFIWDKTFDQISLFVMLGFWCYMLVILAFLFMAWINEELDVVIITNERVVSHDQIDVFHRQVSETSIAQVQDVIGTEEGVWGNLFHYGTLKIQTAAKDIMFTIKHVGKPYEAARKILNIRDQYLDKEKFEKPFGYTTVHEKPESGAQYTDSGPSIYNS
jgi:hypothetical protein